jgi:hypothetical protein
MTYQSFANFDRVTAEQLERSSKFQTAQTCFSYDAFFS